MPPSPVPEGSEEDSSPRGSASDNGNTNGSDVASVTRPLVETHDKSSEVNSSNFILILMRAMLVSKLTEEKNTAIQQSDRLRQELELLRGQVNNSSRGGASFKFVVFVGLLGIILGYIMKTM
ncbi:hypothetical protein SAY87_014021 [Trapa incisa]|uniref:Uncharacterized protein n=1 Tax=Trapa incisa TaxID=236973 RepID=A0AAN7GVA4_9MYRT|nr:hypothetical protein SAY87_014021 [Trapa incisa]